MQKTLLSLVICLFFYSISKGQNCNNWLRLQNSGDRVSIGDLDVTGDQITVEANFNPDQSYAMTGIASNLVSKHTQPNNCNYLLRPLTAEITTTNGYVNIVACDYQVSKTYHAALVYNGSSLKFYRNGILLGEKPASGNLVTNDLLTTIGENAGYSINGITGVTKGYINEVRIWNVARTQIQIQTFMNAALPSPATQTGLLAYYTFDNLQNKQGNIAFNGTLAGTATINNVNPNCNYVADSCISAQCNNWLKINNAFDAVTLGDLDITGNKMTIEASFNATGDITRTLVSKHYYEIDVNYHLLPDLAQITTTNGFFMVEAPCVFIKNKTYHVAMVYDGATLKLYRNGFLMGSTPATGNLVTNNWPTAIGENAYAAFTHNINNSHPLKGYINEVRLWNVARTQPQIQSYLNNSLPSPSTQTGLLGYYTFNNLQNKQGNTAFNGTLDGSATINNVNPNCTYIADSCSPANCNNWLRLQNSGDRVSIGDIDLTGNQITVEANFNADQNYAMTGIASTLVSKHTQPNNCNYLLRPLTGEITTTNGYVFIEACDYLINKTYHVALVYNGSSLKFYRNGILMGQKPASGNLVTNNLLTTIGENAGYSMNGISGVTKGYINEVRLWNIARSQIQIQTYMNNTLPAPTTQVGLVAYYTFNNLQNKQGNSAFNGSLLNSARINEMNPNCSFIADSCSIILPVTLNDFTATSKDNKMIKLQWNTEAEIGIKTYTIQRSESPASGYINIGTLNSTAYQQRNNYTFTDHTVKPNVLYYYRLAIVGNTGEINYSSTKTARIGNSNFYISAYPSPTRGIVQLQIGNFTGTANITVVNNLGQVVLERKILPINASSVVLDLTRQSKGSYWINVKTNMGNTARKIIKL